MSQPTIESLQAKIDELEAFIASVDKCLGICEGVGLDKYSDDEGRALLQEIVDRLSPPRD